MFSMLDAEFACILYDGETGEFIAARDPIGIRPLYYGYDTKGVIVFASEPKNLVGLVRRDPALPAGLLLSRRRVPPLPGHRRQWNSVCRDDLDTACGNIRDKLMAGVEKRLVADAKVGFLLSGGLDSSLVCAIAARKSDTPIRTFAIGMQAGRHRLEVRPAGGGLYGQRPHRGVHDPGGGHRLPGEGHPAAGHL